MFAILAPSALASSSAEMLVKKSYDVYTSTGLATGPPGPALPKPLPGTAKAALMTLVPCHGQGTPQLSRFSVPIGETKGTFEIAVNPAGVSVSGSNPMSRMAGAAARIRCKPVPSRVSSQHAPRTVDEARTAVDVYPYADACRRFSRPWAVCG